MLIHQNTFLCLIKLMYSPKLNSVLYEIRKNILIILQNFDKCGSPNNFKNFPYFVYKILHIQKKSLNPFANNFQHRIILIIEYEKDIFCSIQRFIKSCFI